MRYFILEFILDARQLVLDERQSSLVASLDRSASRASRNTSVIASAWASSKPAPLRRFEISSVSNPADTITGMCALGTRQASSARRTDFAK